MPDTPGRDLGLPRKPKPGTGMPNIQGSPHSPLAATSASISGILGGGSGQPRKPKQGTGTQDIKGSAQLDFELGSADPARSEGIISSNSISTSTLSAAEGASILGILGGGSGQPSKPKGTGTLDIKGGSAYLDHELGSANSARFEGVVSSDSTSTSALSAAGNASILGILGGGSGQPRKAKSGTGIPDIYEPGPVALAPNVDQETQGKRTDHGAPATTVGHRSHQPRKKVAITRPINSQGPDVIFYEEQLERLRSELSRASARADELQQRHDAQSKVLGSAHSQLKIKTEQITNARRDYEKLQGDLSACSAQTLDLQKRYDTQSQDIHSTRHDLQAKVSLLEEKEHVIISLSDKVTQAEHKNRTMADQVATAQGAVDQLRVELSSSSSRTTEVQKRYEAQSQELDAARDELRQLKGLYQDDSSNQNVADHIRSALEEKNQQIEVLREDLAASTSRNNELQKSYETLSRDVSDLRDELKVKTSQYEGTITSLDVQVKRWKSLDGDNKEQIATSLKQVKELQDDLSSSTSQLAQLQGRYDVQSRELTTVRDELHSSILSCDSKERTIVSLNTKVEQWEGVSAEQAEQLATALKQVEALQRDPTSVPRYIELHALYEEQTEKLDVAQQHLSISASDIETLQNLYEKRSNELTVVRKELNTSISSGESKDLTIATLNVEVQKWKDAGADESKQIATILERAKKLEDDLSTSTSKLDELQHLHEEQSSEFARVRNELKTSVSSGKDKDLTISTLTTEIGQWKGAGVDEPKKVTIILELVKKLRGDLSTSTSKLDELQSVHEKQSDELASVRADLQASISSGKDKDLTIAGLTDEVQQWKDAGADESKQIATLLEQVKKLQDDLATSTSKLDELQKLYQNQSDALTVVHDELQVSISSGIEKDVTIATLTAEVGEWKSAGVDEPKKVEKLRQEHSTSAAQLVQLRTVYEEQSSTLTVVQKELQASILSGKDKDTTITALTDEVQQWKDAGTDESKQVAALVEQVKKLQDDLATSTSKLNELQVLYQNQSDTLTVVRNDLQVSISSGKEKDVTIATLTAEAEEWKISVGVDEPKKVAVILEQAEKLRTLYEERSSTLTVVQKELQASISSGKHKDVTIIAPTDEVQQWKDASASGSREVATILKQVAKLQQNLSASVSELEELHNLYEEQSSKLTAVQNELKASISTGEKQGLTIAALTEEVRRWKDAGSNESKQVATILKQVDRLQSDLSTSASELAQFKDLYEQQLHDLTIMRKELQARILSEEGKDRELAVTREDLEQLRDDLTTATSQIERLKESEAAAADELTAADKDLEQLHRDLSASSSQITEIRRRYEAQSSELEQWKNSDAAKALQITAAGEKLVLHQQELSTMSSQLDKVHRFLTIADTHPDTAIIQMVQKLNAEVHQNTTFIAECILDEFQPQGETSSEEQDPAIQRVSVHIGQALAGSLRSKRDDLALYLQIAFQAFLTHYLSGVISAWTTEEGHSDLIDTIYQRLQTQEAQTISGHWRSLTRTYISPTCSSHPDTIISSTVAGLSDILVAAGCATSAATAKRTVTSKFLDKVSSIIWVAGQLSKMIGEVVSSDFKVLAIQPNVVFEETKMEEDVGDYDDRDTAGGIATGERVLCSTHLGLTKHMPLESGKVTLTAMKAKVLLEYFLNA